MEGEGGGGLAGGTGNRSVPGGRRGREAPAKARPGALAPGRAFGWRGRAPPGPSNAAAPSGRKQFSPAQQLVRHPYVTLPWGIVPRGMYPPAFFCRCSLGGRAGREGWGKRCAHVGRRRAGALEKGGKSISLGWIALHFPGKMGTIARRINLEKDFGYGTRNENAAI